MIYKKSFGSNFVRKEQLLNNKIAINNLKSPDVWDAGKMKKGVPGLRRVFVKQKREAGDPGGLLFQFCRRWDPHFRSFQVKISNNL